MSAGYPLREQEQIANKLLVKLAIQVPSRTVSKYLPKRAPGQTRRDQRWSAFLKNRTTALSAGGVRAAVVATIRWVHGFAVSEHGEIRTSNARRLRAVAAGPTSGSGCQAGSPAPG